MCSRVVFSVAGDRFNSEILGNLQLLAVILRLANYMKHNRIERKKEDIGYCILLSIL